MWQITWMLEFLPNWFWTTLLFLSIVGLVLSWLLSKLPYSLTIKVVSIIGISASLWFLGAASNEEKWQAKVKELEEKISVAEQESKEVTKEVEVQVVEKIQMVKGKTEYITKNITEYIDREVVKKEEVIKYVENCPLPKEIVEAHNAAAEMNRAAEGTKK
jgi:hypothetical protein